MTSTKHSGRVTRRFLHLGGIAAAISLAGPAAASTDLGHGITMNHLVNLTYSAAVRVDSPDEDLLANVNGDDGNRNFDDGSLINNRIAALGELNFRRGDYGVFLRGSAFYDQAYRSRNDNDSPGTVNKDGDHREFTPEAKRFLGRRARMLDAYAYGTWYIGDTSLDVRAGDQVVSWGESLFFPNMSGAQAPADATRSNVPGTEVKDVLLPIGQIYAQWGLTSRISIAAYYQYEWEGTELNPAGGYFSTTDILGPGASRLIVQLPSPPSPVARVDVPRGADITPGNSGQWGVSTKLLLGGVSELGVYHIRYHDKAPLTAVFNNPDFVSLVSGNSSYQFVYVDGIHMSGLSLTTDVGGAALASELSFRQDAGLAVNAPGLAGAPSPAPTRGDVWQANLSATQIILPTRFWDQLTLLGEASWLKVDRYDRIEDSGSGQTFDELSNGREAAAYQALAQFTYKQVLSGWDFTLSLIHAQLVKGKSPIAGALGSLTGERDKRYSVGLGFKYLNNLELQTAYNGFHGSPDVSDRPLADRSYVSFSAKYSF